jgi:hypothetical protein
VVASIPHGAEQASLRLGAIMIQMQGAAGGGGGLTAGADGGGTPPPPGVALYLELSQDKVTPAPDPIGSIIVLPHRCKTSFCPECSPGIGRRVRRRLLGVVGSWRSPMMLTLTIDPELFESPKAAFDYVSEHRCISVLMQNLRRFGVLEDNRRGYFYVVEWQQNGWPHWHVLVDADFIPFDKLAEAWNRNWDGWRERVVAGRPGFGSVRFSKPGKTSRHAAMYATKYLIKFPEHGFPDWVMDQPRRRVHRYSVSRGFWPTEEESQDDERADDLADDADLNDEPEAAAEPERQDDEQPPTIRQLVEGCGLGDVCKAFEIIEKVDEETGELRRSLRFAGNVQGALHDLASTCELEVDRQRIAFGSTAAFRTKFEHVGPFNFKPLSRRLPPVVQCCHTEEPSDEQNIRRGAVAGGPSGANRHLGSGHGNDADGDHRACVDHRFGGRRGVREGRGVAGVRSAAGHPDVTAGACSVVEDHEREAGPEASGAIQANAGKGEGKEGCTEGRAGVKQFCNTTGVVLGDVQRSHDGRAMVNSKGGGEASPRLAPHPAQLEATRKGRGVEDWPSPPLSGGGTGCVDGSTSCFTH